MAVLNVTPDSFYAASRIRAATVAQIAAEAIAAGADMLDVGAESTRPGAAALTAEEEQARLLPALAQIAAARERGSDALISVDTRHAATAERALAAGADIINDVSGLGDPDMAELLARAQCGVVLMHRRGEFATMQHLAPLADPATSVRARLEALTARAVASGIARERIVVDAGFGFGKNLGQNFPVLARLDELHGLGFGVLAGMSRKSFLRRGPEQPPEERLAASLAAAAAAVLAGAHVLRVHDVGPTREAARVADALLGAV